MDRWNNSKSRNRNISKIEELDSICNVLLREYLDIDYKVIQQGKTYIIDIQTESGHSNIITYNALNGIVRQKVKDTYREQNGLND